MIGDLRLPIFRLQIEDSGLQIAECGIQNVARNLNLHSSFCILHLPYSTGLASCIDVAATGQMALAKATA